MARWAYVLVALAVVAMLLVLNLPMPAIAVVILDLFATASIMLVAMWAIAKWVVRRDPYSLHSLRKVHERAGWEEAEEIGVDRDADIYCPNCGTVRGASVPVCPHCRV